MAANGTSLGVEPGFEEEIFGVHPENGQSLPPDQPPVRRRFSEYRLSESAHLRAVGGTDTPEDDVDFTLAPLVDKMAYSIARGLGVAMKEVEDHIAAGARKVSDTIERQMTLLQGNLAEISAFVQEQRALNQSLQERLEQISAEHNGLRETDARHAADLESLRTETQGFSSMIAQKIETANASLHESVARQSSELEAMRTETRAFSDSVLERIDVTVAALNGVDERHAAGLAELQDEVKSSHRSIGERMDSISKDFSVHQEDVAAINATLSSTCSRIDSLVERLDRQADAVRLLQTTYGQREAELEHLVEGLARLRSFPKSFPTEGL